MNNHKPPVYANLHASKDRRAPIHIMGAHWPDPTFPGRVDGNSLCGREGKFGWRLCESPDEQICKCCLNIWQLKYASSSKEPSDNE